MGISEMSESGLRKPPLSAKVILNQRYGGNACYRIEEVPETVEDDCPGLVILNQKRARVLYRCHLQLPEFSLVSENFAKKKDAEQSVAQMALDKLGIKPDSKDHTAEEAYDELVTRISYLFSEKFCLSGHPIVNHIQAAIRREGDNHGMIPVSVVATLDTKIANLSKLLNPKTESDPILVMSLVLAAARSVDSICISSSGLWMGKKGSYSPEVLQSLALDSSNGEDKFVRALFVPASTEMPVETITLELRHGRCYLIEVSRKLSVKDSSYVLFSRPVGRASSERRFYFSSQKCRLLCNSNSLETTFNEGEAVNTRASCFSGQNITGNAILATIGYQWKSMKLIHEDVTLSTYYRMLLGMTPEGCYKLSRGAMLIAKLPSAFTSKSNWRGHFPRELLSMFCRNHRLMEPLFLIKEIPLKDSHQTEEKISEGSTIFVCKVQVLSKRQELLLEFIGKSCKKQVDAVQKAALSTLSWLNAWFEHNQGNSITDSTSLKCPDAERFISEFSSYSAVHARLQDGNIRTDKDEESNLISLQIKGPETVMPPLTLGSLVLISYFVHLVDYEGDDCERHTLESKEKFEFELGVGAVIDHIEYCVSQMCVGQTAQFITSHLPRRELVLAASGQSAELLSSLDLRKYSLQYSLKLHQVSEPNEDRMEGALFSPSLSRQRVDFALDLVNAARAISLVDFGCGSGNLLDALLVSQTTLKRITGVDISLRGLYRAAKLLHTKLSSKEAVTAGNCIRSAALYCGSITDYDSRLHGFDVATCLEVIEHMEEEEAIEFGHVALGQFSPGLLIVSTPNYEYNPLLQGELTGGEGLGEKQMAGPCRFRNHDHKFEWTRAQFRRWAVDLAVKYGYHVDFGGVGGSGDTEPGFASQVAIFRRQSPCLALSLVGVDTDVMPYEVVWKWP
ncbi:small RNA 2'-O-methyltransferase-like [Wolffia australiana]